VLGDKGEDPNLEGGGLADWNGNPKGGERRKKAGGSVDTAGGMGKIALPEVGGKRTEKR